ncbi:MAG: glycosyltransferase family 2 protein [Thermoplasmatota archaeon]
MITAVIPAYNEGNRIEKVLKEIRSYVDEIIVIDDNSSDDTAAVASEHANVMENEKNLGYIGSIKRGFKEASGDIIVTLDADGEHDPKFIPELVRPILDGEADLVFGKRDHVPRPSERLLSRIAQFKVKTKDTGTGYRALRKDLADKLGLKGKCTCGIFALEAHSKGAKITEIKAPTRDIDKPRRISWDHIPQFFIVIYWFLKA